MDNYMLRVLARKAGVRGLACISTAVAQEAAERHGTQPTASATLGMALTGGLLLGALLKVGHRVALKFEGNGPLRKILVEADHYGRVRGYTAVTDVELPRTLGQQFDTVAALGNEGFLTVVKDVRLKELTEGVVELTAGNIDDHLTRYLTQSEQIPSTTQIGIHGDEAGNILAAGGILIQSLPPYDEEVINTLQDRLGEMPPVVELLQTGKTPEDIIALAFAGIEYEILETYPVQFRCHCSRERMEQGLLLLGADELQELVDTQEEIVIECHFCHETYVFDTEDIKRLLSESS